MSRASGPTKAAWRRSTETSRGSPPPNPRRSVSRPSRDGPADVAPASNAAYGGQVRAAVVDLGTGTNHDYRISLQSTTPGPMNGSTTLDLQNAGGAGLQTQQIPALSLSAASWNATADATGSRSTY